MQKESARNFHCTIRYIVYKLDISEGTVATNLAELMKQGLIEKVSVIDYYDKDPHRKDNHIGLENNNGNVSFSLSVNKSGATIRRFVGYRALSDKEIEGKLLNWKPAFKKGEWRLI